MKPWEAINLPSELGLSVDEALAQIRPYPGHQWQRALRAATQDRRAMLMAAAYDLKQKHGIYDPEIIGELTTHPVAGMAKRFEEDFPKASGYQSSAWSGGIYQPMQPRPLLARAITHIPDAGCTARMRKAFPGMSLLDRYVFAGALRDTDNLCLVPDLITAAKQAESLDTLQYPKFPEFFRATASGLFFQARKDPSQQDAVRAMREHLKGMGDVARFLVDEDDKGRRKGETKINPAGTSPTGKWHLFEMQSTYADGSRCHGLILSGEDNSEGKQAVLFIENLGKFQIKWAEGEGYLAVENEYDGGSVALHIFRIDAGDNGQPPTLRALWETPELPYELGQKYLLKNWRLEEKKADIEVVNRGENPEHQIFDIILEEGRNP